jgi:OOP family OmpA-OmpF porin
MKYVSTVLLCFIIVVAARSQNLVVNGGFEEFNKCPGSYFRNSGEFNIRGWTSVGTGTPDHFHECSNGDADVPHNWAGVSHAQEGVGYAGIFAWMNYSIDYREYLQGILESPLIQDSTYEVSFYYKLSSYSMYAIDRIGISLSVEQKNVKHDRVIFEKPTFEVIQPEALTKETGLWQKASFRYKALGGERYVIIGNFNDKESCNYYAVKYTPMLQDMLKFSSYYYIDNVRVSSPYSEEEKLPSFASSEVMLDVTYVLSHVHFETNKYKLRPGSFEMLDELAAYLHKHPSLSVVVSGHTDDVGGEKYNQQLSEQRARTVKHYLSKSGIQEDRIIARGYGKQKPLLEGTSEFARSKNRRVEVSFQQ